MEHRHGRLWTVVGIALATLIVAEVAVRASSLPEPQIWLGPEMQIKENQMDDLERRGGASVIFLGSSTVDAAVDPSLIDVAPGARPAYNASTGAGSMGMIDTWARLVAVPKLRPDVAVLGLVSRELNPNDPEQARLEREFFESTAVERLRGTQSLIEEIEQRAEDISALVKYRTVLRQPRRIWGRTTTGQFGEIVAEDGQYEGFINTSYRLTPAMVRQFQNRAVHNYKIGPGRVATLRRLMSFLRTKGIALVVVNMPVTADYVGFHPRGQADYDEYVAVLQQEAAKAGAHFVNVGVWPNELFADAGHVNGAGSRQLSTLLAGELQKHPPPP